MFIYIYIYPLLSVSGWEGVSCKVSTACLEMRHLISFHLISSHFIPFHLISFHFISFHFISFHFISFRFISFRSISSHFISSHFISSHFIPFHLISFHFISFHLISLQGIEGKHDMSFHRISFRLMSPHPHTHPIHTPSSHHIASTHSPFISSHAHTSVWMRYDETVHTHSSHDISSTHTTPCTYTHVISSQGASSYPHTPIAFTICAHSTQCRAPTHICTLCKYVHIVIYIHTI